jgi:hypothetical protein
LGLEGRRVEIRWTDVEIEKSKTDICEQQKSLALSGAEGFFV